MEGLGKKPQVQTVNDSAAVTTRQRTTANGFEVRLQEEQNADGVHANESIAYIAISLGEGLFGKFQILTGLTPQSVSHNWYNVTYNFGVPTFGKSHFLANLQSYFGSDTAHVRYNNLSNDNVDVRVEEEQSKDAEINHANEIVGYMLIKQANFDESKLTPIEGTETHDFGRSVDIENDLMVIGAPSSVGSGSIGNGSVHIYERNFNGYWMFKKKLTVSITDVPNGGFGYSVAISGDAIAVGAHPTGAAFVFHKNHGGNNNWGLAKRIVAPDIQPSDQFAISVDIAGDVIVVGSQNDDDQGNNSGSAYIFQRNQGGSDQWGMIKKIIASDGAASDFFGNYVAASQNVILIGAHLNDGNAIDSGAAYIFERDSGGIDQWGEVKKLIASDGVQGDLFGLSVDISGDSLVVGANQADSSAIDSGSAYVFSRDEGGLNNWGQVQKLIAFDGETSDFFGTAVSIGDDIVVIGSWGDDYKGISDAGSAYVFSRDEGGLNNWGQVQKVIAIDGNTGNRFGRSVANMGHTILAGAPLGQHSIGTSGSVYVFE